MLEPFILIGVFGSGLFFGIPLGWMLRKFDQKRLERERKESEARISRVKTERAGRPNPPRKGAGQPIRKYKLRRSRR